MSELMLRALCAACGIGLLAGMLGNFVVWRRMSYMGDAMGHASLLGVVLGLMLGIMPPYTVAMVAIAIGFMLGIMQKDRRLPFDALLGVVSTGGLALGLLLYGMLPTRQVDLYGYLFGDVLAVSDAQLALIYAALLIQGALISMHWRPLLRMIMHEEIARVEHVPVARLQILMTMLIAMTVALALQVVGMLLITAMLVIPPLTARLLAGSPLQMMLGSMACGAAAAIGGVGLSYNYNLSTGPSIVLVAVTLFAVAFMAGKLFRRQH
jgi:zinc transport system permease protein